MQLGGRHGPLRKVLEALAQEAIRIQQHLVTKEHVVDADDARFVQLGVTELEGAAMQRVIERMVDVVVEVGAGADNEVYRAALHQRDDATTDAGWGHCAGNRQADRHVLLGIEHAAGEEPGSLADTPGVVGLKRLVDQVRSRDIGREEPWYDALASQIRAGVQRLLLRWLLVRHGLVGAVWRWSLMWAVRHGILALCWRRAAARAHILMRRPQRCVTSSKSIAPRARKGSGAGWLARASQPRARGRAAR